MYWLGGWNCQLLNRGGPFGVPIQWLTTAHKIPCWRGDGSRSGPSPCKARRDITPLSSLVTASIIKSHSVPGLWPGAARLFSGGCGRVFSWCPVGARRLWRWEVLLILSGAAEAAASEGLIYLCTVVSKTKDLPVRVTHYLRGLEYIADFLISVCGFLKLFVCGFLWITETMGVR